LRTAAPSEGCGASSARGGWIQLIYAESQRQGNVWSQYQLLSSSELEKANTEEKGGKGRVSSGIQPGRLPGGRATGQEVTLALPI